MTGSALNLALKLVVLHVELKNVKHGVVRDALVDVLRTQILFHWIGLKKLAINMCIVHYNFVVHYILRYHPPPPQPILDKNRTNGIGLVCLVIYL